MTTGPSVIPLVRTDDSERSRRAGVTMVGDGTMESGPDDGVQDR